ncbi:hypothetical protein Pcinc_031885 [Petrolisthes cinctipes]|uniref:Uncharacterized protein n=1 Tax=Petrolisthes cinctipes TaxID=88211 RepID=A0AAE1EVN4_PETCI|nr:hypothetical protein Pcinc_031885 [Petrolisthes cinctipes]
MLKSYALPFITQPPLLFLSLLTSASLIPHHLSPSIFPPPHPHFDNPSPPPSLTFISASSLTLPLLSPSFSLTSASSLTLILSSPSLSLTSASSLTLILSSHSLPSPSPRPLPSPSPCPHLPSPSPQSLPFTPTPSRSSWLSLTQHDLAA